MGFLEVLNYETKQIVFSGRFNTVKDCIEAAIYDNVDLSKTDLRHVNLNNANLDDARLNGAKLDGANLSGANMSETHMSKASLKNTTLHAACLCLADLRGCDMRGALFGATDIAGARMDDAKFSTISAFGLNFIDCASMTNCLFYEEDFNFAFSTPPLFLQGLSKPVIFTDNHLKIGSQTKLFEQWAIPINDNQEQAEKARYGFDSEQCFFLSHQLLMKTINSRVS
jgi:hypothetical protein